MLSIKSLNKSYGAKQVLRKLSVSFEDGQVHGIIGLNGAGKTTFFNCLCDLLEYEGEIVHDTIGKLKNHIGYVPTEPYFFPRTKGKEYLDLIRHAKGEKNISESILSFFDLPLNEYVDNYSTGMKRKIAFMGAMIGSADIYILDEPFNGVDIKSNLVLKQKILELKKQGKTVLLSSHIISSLAELCDNVYMLKDGAISRHYQPAEYAEIETDMLEVQQ